MRCLRPFPVTVTASRAAGEIGALEDRALRKCAGRCRRATPARRRRAHGSTASRPSPAASPGSAMRLAAATGKRPRQRLADLRRAHGGERADLALAVAFEIAAQSRACRQACASASGCRSPRRGARRGRRARRPARSAASSFSDGGPPRCPARKARNCAHVAPVGFERFRRIAALGAEMAQPAFDLGGDFGRDRACLGLRSRSTLVSPVVKRGPVFAAISRVDSTFAGVSRHL